MRGNLFNGTGGSRPWNIGMPFARGLNAEGMWHEYSVGLPDPASIWPEGYTLDAGLLARPGSVSLRKRSDIRLVDSSV
jgi:hypothetical protein